MRPIVYGAWCYLGEDLIKPRHFAEGHVYEAFSLWGLKLVYEALSYLGEDLIKPQHFAEGHNEGS
jgi:hypothetical protein